MLMALHRVPQFAKGFHIYDPSAFSQVSGLRVALIPISQVRYQGLESGRLAPERSGIRSQSKVL